MVGVPVRVGGNVARRGAGLCCLSGGAGARLAGGEDGGDGAGEVLRRDAGVQDVAVVQADTR